jgi:hypothetical protein
MYRYPSSMPWPARCRTCSPHWRERLRPVDLHRPDIRHPGTRHPADLRVVRRQAGHFSNLYLSFSPPARQVRDSAKSPSGGLLPMSVTEEAEVTRRRPELPEDAMASAALVM